MVRKFAPETRGIQKKWHSALYWYLFDNTAKTKWPKWIHTLRNNFEHIHDNQVVFINHATTLITMHGMHIITDPVFSQRIGPFKVPFLSYKRVHDPLIHIENLPKIDVVLLSHNHYDHCDKWSLQKLYKLHNPMFIVPVGDARLLIRFGIPAENIYELHRGDTHVLGGISITGETAAHWSGRGALSMNRSHWLSYVIEYKNKKVFFAGDTGYGKHFGQIGEKYDTLDCVLLPIGAYEPRWMMREQHMDPGEAVQAYKDLRAKKAMAIHFGTFKLSKEDHGQPVDELRHVLLNGDDNESVNFFIPDLQTHTIVIDF
jgi:L-ascorbate metabolism protein UlaG (beta-lactamase superfamily)